MSERVVLIELGRLECADCLTTLSNVLLPKMPGVLDTTSDGTGLRVTLNDEVLTEEALIERLTEAGLLR